MAASATPFVFVRQIQITPICTVACLRLTAAMSVPIGGYLKSSADNAW
jgi:hypothetical protein